MTIGAVGSSAGGTFIPLETEGDFTSVAAQLAMLVLENEETQKQIDRDSLSNARERYREALAEEVSALREQADGTRLGAIVTGTLAVSSAGLGVWASALDCEPDQIPWQRSAGDGLGRLAQPLGAYVSHNYGAANATSAQGARDQASWEMEDLRQEIDEADSTQDKALDWVTGLVERDAAATSAILANKA